jgi:hypothetical protein
VGIQLPTHVPGHGNGSPRIQCRAIVALPLSDSGEVTVDLAPACRDFWSSRCDDVIRSSSQKVPPSRRRATGVAAARSYLCCPLPSELLDVRLCPSISVGSSPRFDCAAGFVLLTYRNILKGQEIHHAQQGHTHLSMPGGDSCRRSLSRATGGWIY